MRSSKNWLGQDFTEWYTAVKQPITNKFIAGLDTNKDLQVKRVSVNDIADKVGADDRGRAQQVKMIFYRQLNDLSKVEVVVGMENQESPQAVRESEASDSEALSSTYRPGINESIYHTTIHIEQKLIDFVKQDGILLVQDLMPNIDKFAKNTTFLRIVWKEVNNLDGSFKK